MADFTLTFPNSLSSNWIPAFICLSVQINVPASSSLQSHSLLNDDPVNTKFLTNTSPVLILFGQQQLHKCYPDFSALRFSGHSINCIKIQ